MNRIICIVGPTASGKTDLSVRLAKDLNTEIVSADSVQVYHEMAIGSARPTIDEMDGVPHHLLDCISLDTKGFSVAMYHDMAKDALDSILDKNRIPVVVGGSGLYVASLIRPLGFAVPSDESIRKELKIQYEENPQSVLEELKRVDPDTGNKLHLNDGKRIIRALEVYKLTGKPLSSFGNDFYNEENHQPDYDSFQIGIDLPREILYERINKRVDQMIETGLLEEAKGLYDKKYDASLPALQALGYRQLFEYFDGLISLEDAVNKIKMNTRHFAKRQMTWFKRDPNIHWITYDGTDKNSLYSKAVQVLKENQLYGA